MADAEADSPALHLVSLLYPLVAGLRINHGLLAVQEISGWGEVMHIGSRGLHGVDKASLTIHVDVYLHPEVPLLALTGLVHLRIPLLLLVLGGAWCRDQGGIDDRALFHGHAVGFEVGFDHLKDLFAEIVLLQQVPERQNGGLIRDPITDHVDPSETAHRWHLDQSILHRWIAEGIPLLEQVDAQHGCQRIGPATTLGAGLGVVGLDEINQRFPRHRLLHFCQKTHAPGALLGRGLLVITESELLAVHVPSPQLRLRVYFRAGGLCFPVSPQ
jgi:hypothetical protein